MLRWAQLSAAPRRAARARASTDTPLHCAFQGGNDVRFGHRSPDTAVLEGHLGRVLDTSGWIGCDFHQHTTGSMDSSQTLLERLRENMSAGLECAAITDHDNTTRTDEGTAADPTVDISDGVEAADAARRRSGASSVHLVVRPEGRAETTSERTR